MEKPRFFKKLPFEVDIDFEPHFGANMAPFGAPKPAKIPPRTHPKSHSNLHRFLHRFWWPFGRQLGPNLAPETAQERPKRRLGGPLEASGGRLGARSRPRAAQTPSRPRFFGPPTYDLDPFRCIFGSILEYFWPLFLFTSRFHSSPKRPAKIACLPPNT